MATLFYNHLNAVPLTDLEHRIRIHWCNKHDSILNLHTKISREISSIDLILWAATLKCNNKPFTPKQCARIVDFCKFKLKMPTRNLITLLVKNDINQMYFMPCEREKKMTIQSNNESNLWKMKVNWCDSVSRCYFVVAGVDRKYKLNRSIHNFSAVQTLSIQILLCAMGKRPKDHTWKIEWD